MSAPHSIRLRLIGWFKRIGDHVAKQLVQKLRRSEVHSDAGSHDDLRLVVGIQEGGSESQGDDTVPVDSLSYRVHVGNGNIGITNFLSVGAYGQRMPGPNHHLICHQKSPAGTSYDVSSLNAHAAGVQR